eukprot:504542_1
MAKSKKKCRLATRGIAPRKQMRIVGEKRKFENDEFYGTDKKRYKLDTNKNALQHENQEYSESDSNSNSNISSDNSSSSDSSSEDASTIYQIDNVSESMRLKMHSALELIKTIFNSNCSGLLKFTNKLHSITEANKIKLEELKYRKEVLNSIFDRYQKEMNEEETRFQRRKQQYSWTKDEKDMRYFNEKIFHFIKANVKGLRFYKMEKSEEWEYDTMHYIDWCVDIALKACKPHIKYSKIMNTLLSKYTNGMKDICSVISEYSHNGYIWYRLKICQQTDEDVCWDDYAPKILYTIEFDVDDYFRDIYYYKDKIPCSGIGISFKSLREELKCKDINNMSNEDLACFIVAIWNVEFNDCLLDDWEHWIMNVHTKDT